MEQAAALDEVARAARHHRELIVEVSHDIWAHPELNFEERHAHELLTDVLDSNGFTVERHAYGLETAFRASLGTGDGPTVTICCEYDALPGIGHACGHNIIAAAGLGAGLALAGVVELLGGRVVVLGTPAEEGGGGKIFMAERGAWDDADVSLMVHPADAELDGFNAIAVHHLACDYHGAASHAAAAPELGRNALDAAVLGYQAVAALRQHIAAHERIHGIFTDGGAKPNIVPSHASTEWYVRSGTAESLAALEPRVLRCLESGALAAGCDFEHRWVAPPYSELVEVAVLQDRWRHHLAGLGRTVGPRAERPSLMGSTDMGNVSKIVPAIHPMIRVAPDGVSIHTPEFAEFARGPAGDAAVVDGAVGLAQVAVDVYSDARLLERARLEWSHADSPGTV